MIDEHSLHKNRHHWCKISIMVDHDEEVLFYATQEIMVVQSEVV